MRAVTLPAAASTPAPRTAVDVVLAARGLLFLGRRYRCPCCGWRFRGFTAGGASLRTRRDGYCPRCGVKQRHRRIWLYLQRHTDLFTAPTRLLHVSPKYGVARGLARVARVDAVGLDLLPGPFVGLVADLRSVPVPTGTFDAAICVHVLEEIEDDLAAMRELHRVLRPGGWALVSVPTRMDQPTYEDPTITTPKERRRAFGERAHVRVYGHDLVDRLRTAGFDVEVDLATAIDLPTRELYGLRDDENIFLCRRP